MTRNPGPTEHGSRPTTVLYIDNSFTFGGAINSLSRLLSALDRRRFRPVVLSAQNPALLARSFPGTTALHWDVKLPWVDKRFQQRAREWPGFDKGPLRFLLDKGAALWWLAFQDLPDAVRIARIAREHGAEILHLNTGINGMLPALLAARLLRVPLVAHARGPQGTEGFRRIYSRLPTHWISVSQSISRNLAEAGVAGDRISVIHNAADLTAFTPVPPQRPVRAELGIPATAPVFAVFGRIIPWKGIREFVLAARAVIEAVPEAYALVVGDRSDGSEQYYHEVVGLTEHLGIAERVIFTGFRDDVADLMRLCDVIVHTSIEPEPFGLTVVEAMATGKPVVAANSGGPLEVVVPEQTGMLVDPTDTASLSGAIVRLLRDPDLASAMGARAAARAHDYYSPARVAREVEAVYERVIGEDRSADLAD